MTQAVVNFVVNNLGEIIEKKEPLLGGVIGEQMKWVKSELQNSLFYISVADSKVLKGDERAESWLNQLRDVASRTNVAIEIFLVEVEDNRQKKTSCMEKFKKTWHKPEELHKLATELGDIRKVLKEISKVRNEYACEILQGRYSEEETDMMPFRRAANLDVDETEMIGLDVDKNNILELLRDEKTRRRAVITIVGSRGIGKTTLARMVYQSSMEDFEYHIMLSVSKPFSLSDLLSTMLKKFESFDPKYEYVGFLAAELRDKLSGLRYLIILDDVWGVDLWNQLKDIFPDDKNGSRVLMTSRSTHVAEFADSGIPPYMVNFLSDEESFYLLCKKALPYLGKDEKCLISLQKSARELSAICRGLPLALVMLGGILQNQKKTVEEWTNVLNTMNWHEEGKDLVKVLAQSYEDMPYNLKACFLYLASFPKDYEISVKRLIRIWVSEGFIPHDGRKTMEETAQDCLSQLSQRNMIQVSSRYLKGSVRKCRVHVLTHAIATHLAEKEKFVTIISPRNFSYHVALVQSENIGSATRRASLLYCDPQLIDHIDQNTGSLLFFFPKYVPQFNKFRLLKVLEIVNIYIPGEKSLMGLDKLIHLKYLGIRDRRGSITIPIHSLAHLKNLETLDLRGQYMGPLTLPSDFWAISTLRHVLYDDCIYGMPPNANLRNLQTIKWVAFDEKPWPINKIPCLTNLRSLGLHGYNHWDVAAHLLGTLPFLISLRISAHPIPKEIIYPTVLPNYHKLETLFLCGSWSESVTFNASFFPKKLIKLTLWDSDLLQDPMEELGKLTKLRDLRLRGNVYMAEQMICPAGFPVLQNLLLDLKYVKVFKVPGGVMPKLESLKNSRDTTLEMPPELKHLTGN